MSIKFGVIFDMDGVVIDNNPYHKLAWQSFAENYGVKLSEEEIREHIFGRVARDTLEYIFNRSITDEEINTYVEEKEKIYRDAYRDHIRPLRGLLPLLTDLQKNMVPLAVATSAPPGNVEFVFNHLPLSTYFQFHLDASDIIKGKPDPEIYEKAVKKLGIPADRCLVFEDSIAGVKAAARAGTRVIGITTTHSADELEGVMDAVSDFSTMSYEKIHSLINK